ncbi:MAG: Na/Pi cotransporter family protein, partial [Firmicutes bacterium]|nr:Na/Pi cotransporter family protein [Bacillota bacterium]
FMKKEKIKDIGQTIFGFGVLFVGINIMGDTMKPLAAMPEFAELMASVSDIPILGLIVGVVSTAIIQSSSAVIAVVQNLASQAGPDGVTSILGLTGAIPILFGSNIGTTITALLASIGGSVNAKRTAAAHSIFNITGSVIFMFLITPFTKVVQLISPVGAELDIISREIANAHMIFNIINAVIWLPFVWLLVKMVTKLVPERAKDRLKSEPMYLDKNILDQPIFAIHLAEKELLRLAGFTYEMVEQARKGFVEGDEEAIRFVKEQEHVVDVLQGTTVEYIASMFRDENLTEYQSKQLAGLVHIAGDLEHIGDYCENIAEFADDKVKKGYVFSDSAYAEIYESFDKVSKMLKDTITVMDTKDKTVAGYVLEQEEEINANEDRLRATHMKRLEEGKCSPEFTVTFTDIIHNIEKIGDSCTNIAEIILVDYGHRDKE